VRRTAVGATQISSWNWQHWTMMKTTSRASGGGVKMGGMTTTGESVIGAIASEATATVAKEIASEATEGQATEGPILGDVAARILPTLVGKVVEAVPVVRASADRAAVTAPIHMKGRIRDLGPVDQGRAQAAVPLPTRINPRTRDLDRAGQAVRVSLDPVVDKAARAGIPTTAPRTPSTSISFCTTISAAPRRPQCGS
jgi:hypothetical protein